jgi:hypothetical protein
MNEDLLIRAAKEAVDYWYHKDMETFNPPLWIVRLRRFVERNTVLKFNSNTGQWSTRKGRKE